MDEDVLREEIIVNSANSEGKDEVPEVNVLTTTKITRSQLITVIILCCVNCIIYMEIFIIAGILGDNRHAFKAKKYPVSILGYMVMVPIYGLLGDRFNRKYLMAAGVSIWSLTMWLGSFLQTFELCLVMRCIAGIVGTCFSTIAPTVISDIFQGDMRSKMLALFYIAIPVGSGLGLTIGTVVRNLPHNHLSVSEAFDADWRWWLRIAPILGIIASLLIGFFLRKPLRGESEGAENLPPTSFLNDLKHLITNKSYVLVTLALTCVTCVAGALAWWAPLYVKLGAELQDDPNIPPNHVSFTFGVVAMLSGLIGVPLGSFAGQRLRAKYSSGDAIVCALGLIMSIPFLIVAIFLAAINVIAAFAFFFFGLVFLNLIWAVVSDMVLYVCGHTRRSSAQAFQILIALVFGDAGSPYIVGLVTGAFKHTINEGHYDILPANSTVINRGYHVAAETYNATHHYVIPYESTDKFYALQNSLLTCIVVAGILAAVFFIGTAFYIGSDNERCER